LRDIEDKIWILFFIAGILLIIAIFTPVAFMYNFILGLRIETLYLWAWGGMEYWSFLTGTEYFIATNPSIVASGVILLIIILLSGFYTLYLANKLRNGRDFREVRRALAITALLVLIATIIIMAIILGVFNLMISSLGIIVSEIQMGPSFGIIGQLIGGGLILTGVIYTQYKLEGTLRSIYKTQSPIKLKERIKRSSKKMKDSLNKTLIITAQKIKEKRLDRQNLKLSKSIDKKLGEFENLREKKIIKENETETTK
jgi:hypothetical protein